MPTFCAVGRCWRMVAMVVFSESGILGGAYARTPRGSMRWLDRSSLRICHLQSKALDKGSEVAVRMQQGQTILDTSCGDDRVDGLAYRYSVSTQCSKVLRRLHCDVVPA